MGVHAGKDGGLLRGTATVAYIDSWTIDKNVDLFDVSGIGDKDKVWVPGQGTVTMQISGTFDSTGAQQAAIRAEMVSTASVSTHTLVALYDATVGSRLGWTGSAFLNNKNISAPKDGKISFSATATFSGGVTAYTTT